MNQTYQIKRTICTKAAYHRIPVSGSFELTPRCNLNCNMCYVRMTPEEMAPIGRERTTQEWLEMGRQARDAGLVFLLLTGGEPMLRPDFGQLYLELTKMGLSISINSNGCLLTEQIRQLFRAYPPALINITLYGTSPESYGRLCGVSSAFEKVKDSILWLKDAGITVNLNATITPWNVQDLDGIYAFAKEHNISMRPTLYNFPPTRRTNKQEFQRLDAQTVGKLLARDVLIQNGIDHVRYQVSKFGTDEATAPGCGLEQGGHLECFAGRSQFWISWDGSMVPCGMLDQPVVKPFEVGFQAAWTELVEKTAAITLCPECTGCKHKDICTKCAAVTYAETGCFHGKPEYMCQVSDSYCEEMLRLADQ